MPVWVVRRRVWEGLVGDGGSSDWIVGAELSVALLREMIGVAGNKVSVDGRWPPSENVVR